uniref:Small ribosomal subunit protein eS27 n=1 Tax=Fervidicoccus fontis TaxID=683846 RepID=A0A7J3ZJT3_9CREN
MVKRRQISIPEPRSRFMLVRCPSCGNEQVVFSHATFPARCIVCGHQLLTSRGGKARVNAQLVKILG